MQLSAQSCIHHPCVQNVWSSAKASKETPIPFDDSFGTSFAADLYTFFMASWASLISSKHLTIWSFTSAVISSGFNVFSTSHAPMRSSPSDSSSSSPVMYVHFLSLIICHTSSTVVSHTDISTAPTWLMMRLM